MSPKRLLTAAVVGFAAGPAVAADPAVEPAGHRSRPGRPAVVVPATPCPPCAPIAPPVAPTEPGATPPATPPGTPGTTTPPRRTDPLTGRDIDLSDPAAPGGRPDLSDPVAGRIGAGGAFAQATAAGTSGYGSAIPGVFGDHFGGGGIAGPLPVLISRSGQFIGFAPQVILPKGQRQTLNNPGGQRTAADELILQRPAVLPPGTPGQAVGLLPPPGTVFAPELAPLVARVPQYVYGAFKITENESPRPTTRAYLSYYFYDNLFRGVGGPDTPRIGLHQEIFGYEQAFADDRFSVGLRLPYNQVDGPPGFTDTRLGNLTIITKGLIAEDEETGSLLSGGLVVTAPTGNPPFASTISGERINSTLLQPYLGFILTDGAAFLQGFNAVVVPTDDRDVTFLTYDFAAGWFAYRAPGQTVSAVVPVAELHLNVPLDHRGKQTEPVGFSDTLTLLGGTHVTFRDRSTLGFAVGAPVTGPRPFSLQATVQLNFRF